jgi:murein DD-endopeptidase MepM/ murein hydrolase activator NlpD
VQRVRRAIAVVVVLAVLPGVAAAEDVPLDRSLEQLDDDRTVVAERLDEARDLEQDARSRLAAVDAELEAAEAELAALEADLEAAIAAVADARERERLARTELAQVLDELDAAELDLADGRSRLEDRAVLAFKHGQLGYAEVVFLAGDINDLVASGRYLRHILADDRELVAEIEALVEGVRSSRDRSMALRREAEVQAALAADAAATIEAATADQARLAELIRVRRAEREAVFVELRDDRAAIESHLAGLEAESQRIEAQLAAIARDQEREAARLAEELERAAELKRLAAEEAQRRYEEEQRRYDEAVRQAALEEEERQRREREAADDCAVVTEQARAEAEAEGRDPDAVTDEARVVEACGPAPAAPAPAAPAPPPPPPPPPPPSGGVGGGEPSVGGWTRPMSGPVSSGFGQRWGRMHRGVDIAAPTGTPVVAARPGVVVHVTNGCHPTSSSGCGGGFGNYVMVAHDGGFATVYAHLATVQVGVGQSVSAGTQLALSGNSGNSTGPHLHFEIRVGGSAVNPCGYIRC